MWVDDWTFQVISPIFAIHWGFQESIDGYSESRKKQINDNTEKFNDFKKEIWLRYGRQVDTKKPKLTPLWWRTWIKCFISTTLMSKISKFLMAIQQFLYILELDAFPFLVDVGNCLVEVCHKSGHWTIYTFPPRRFDIIFFFCKLDGN